MSDLADDLAVDHPEIGFAVVHVNGAGYDSGIPDLSLVTDDPIVQDDSTALVWTNWAVEWRDVYVLTPDNELYAVFNLTDYPLSDSANRDALYQLFVDAASAR